LVGIFLPKADIGKNGIVFRKQSVGVFFDGTSGAFSDESKAHFRRGGEISTQRTSTVTRF
jgi:hypothetical protein